MINELSMWTLSIVSINLAIAIAAICVFRFLFGVLAGVNTTVELAEKDNYAFGITFAGGAGALGLVLSAAVTGDSAVNLLNEAINVVTYALAGIVLLKIGSIINDYVIFHKVSLKTAISEHQLAAGYVQAANFLALGLIISSTVNWVEHENWQGLPSVLALFFGTQLILLLVTRLRAFIYRRRHNGESLQKAIVAGNTALAIRYSGHVLGTALAMTAGANLVEYFEADPLQSVAYWLGVGACLALLLPTLALIARKVILIHINVAEEVDEQQNIGVASIEAVIYIAVSLLIIGVLA